MFYYTTLTNKKKEKDGQIKNNFNINKYIIKNNNKEKENEKNSEEKINLVSNGKISFNMLRKHMKNKFTFPLYTKINLLKQAKNNLNNDPRKTSTSITKVKVDTVVDLGFKQIKPRIDSKALYAEVLDGKFPLYKNRKLFRPILLKSMPKPKLNVPRFSNIKVN